jgi:acyl dehydratase
MLRPLVSSDPILVDQPVIDHFAHVSQDYQWIHIDRERAAAELPHKTTIAHGLLTLSLIPAWYKRCFTFSNCKLKLNYGFDKGSISCSRAMWLRDSG